MLARRGEHRERLDVGEPVAEAGRAEGEARKVARGRDRGRGGSDEDALPGLELVGTQIVRRYLLFRPDVR